jgi:hypothetical protein
MKKSLKINKLKKKKFYFNNEITITNELYRSSHKSVVFFLIYFNDKWIELNLITIITNQTKKLEIFKLNNIELALWILFF